MLKVRIFLVECKQGEKQDVRFWSSNPKKIAYFRGLFSFLEIFLDSDDEDEDDDDDKGSPMENVEEYISPEQINEELVTLSMLPESRWRNLVNLDLIKVNIYSCYITWENHSKTENSQQTSCVVFPWHDKTKVKYRWFIVNLVYKNQNNVFICSAWVK